MLSPQQIQEIAKRRGDSVQATSSATSNPNAAADFAKRVGLNTEKGVSPTFKATIGGASSIIPNIAKTIGNIPSNAGNLIHEAVISPAEKIGESIKLTGDIYKDRGAVEGTKDIAKGVGETASEIFKAPGEFLVGKNDKMKLVQDLSPLQEHAVKQRDEILQKIAEKRKNGEDTSHLVKALKFVQDSLSSLDEQIGSKETRNNEAVDTLTNIAKYPIERPLDVPAAIYTGESAAGKGDIIENIAGKVTQGADTSLANIANKTNQAVVKPTLSTLKGLVNIPSTVEENVAKVLKNTGKMGLGTTAGDRINKAANALNTIRENAPNIKVLDINGNEVAFNPAKATFLEMPQALKQTKDAIYKEYSDIAKTAGDEGIQFTQKDFRQLENFLNKYSEKGFTPAFSSKAKQLKETLARYGKVNPKDNVVYYQNADPIEIQSLIEKINLDVNPLSDKAAAQVSGEFSQELRGLLDSKLEASGNPAYQATRDKYAQLKSIEPDIIARYKEALRKAGAKPDLIDAITGLDALMGLITMSPTQIARAGLTQVVKRLYGYLRDPEVNMQRAFRLLEEGKGGQRGLINADQSTQPPTITQNNPTIPNTVAPNKGIVKSILDIPNREGGFVALSPYKETGNITTKILKDLEGKTTVSRQYILDATNRGELKQVERDLTREVLDSMPKGEINVQEFADKLKAELLPLEIRTPEDFNPRLDEAGENYHPEGGGTPLHENVVLSDELRGDVKDYTEHVFESPVATSAGRTHFAYGNQEPQNYFGHTRIEDMADNKTRRVIEVQSDLYQKGKLDYEGAQAKEIKSNPTYAIENRKNFKNPEAHDMINSEADRRLKEVLKLEQYNDPTAHFRMIREEIKKAAQDGKTKLQFPTGETAMKIEGLGDSTRWSYEGFKEVTPDKLKVGSEIIQNEGQDGSKWIITDVLGDGKFKAVPKDLVDKMLKQDAQYVDNPISRQETLKRADFNYGEQFDISGKIDTSNPIYKFYQKDVQQYLKRFGGKAVTDKKGVTWIEVPIKKEWGKQPVEAFGKISLNPLFLGAGAATAAVVGSKLNK
jgi:hypothetical protein